MQHRPANLHLLRAFGSLLQAEFTESRLKRMKSEAGEFVSGSEDEHIHQQHIHIRGDWTEEKQPVEEEEDAVHLSPYPLNVALNVPLCSRE